MPAGRMRPAGRSLPTPGLGRLFTTLLLQHPSQSQQGASRCDVNFLRSDSRCRRNVSVLSTITPTYVGSEQKGRVSLLWLTFSSRLASLLVMVYCFVWLSQVQSFIHSFRSTFDFDPEVGSTNHTQLKTVGGHTPAMPGMNFRSY